MIKRVISIIITIALSLSMINISVFGAGGETFDYLPGLIEYYQELNKPSSSVMAFCGSAGADISGGGNVRYDFILPFDAATLDITYEAEADVTLKLSTKYNDYEVSLSSFDTTYQLELAPEHLGVTYMMISADSDILISELKYTKVEHTCQNGDDGDTTFSGSLVYTEYQDALKTAVVVGEGLPVVKTRNLVRYINFDDTSEVTTLTDGKMYLPIDVLARAFSLYYEDYPDKTYAYISGDNFALYLRPGNSYFESTGVRADFNDIVIYKNGKTYIPVREVAEILGYTVYYKDGLAVIDNKIAANKILSDTEIFEELKEELSAYKKDDKKSKNKIYHVSKSEFADDENIGTEEAPFNTIQRAADVAKAGDTVIIHEGVYREKVTVKNSGTPAKPIIFKAAEGEEVTLSAFKTVSGFTPYTNPANNVEMHTRDLSDLLFECALQGAWDVDRNFVLYNNDVLAEGRHPNEKTSAEKTEVRDVVVQDGNTKTIEQRETTFIEAYDLNPAYPYKEEHKLLPTIGDMRIRDEVPKGNPRVYNHIVKSEIDLNQDTEDYWKGATYIGKTGKAWNLSAALVTSSTKNQAAVSEYYEGNVGTVTYYERKDAEDYGYLTHHLNTVDKAGEWYIDVDTKRMYVIPPQGADPDTMEFEVKERQVLFDMRGKEYVQLHNVNTRGGGITMAECVGCVVNGGSHKYISQLDLSSAHCVQDMDSIYKRYDTIKNKVKFEGGEDLKKTSLTGEAGLVVSGLYNAVVNTDIEYSSTAGILIRGSYQYVENNVVDKTGYGITYPAGIYFMNYDPYEGYPVGGHQIYQNTSLSAGRACIGGDSDGSVAPMDIAFNELGWGNICAMDTGVFYFYGMVGGTDLTRTTIHHNIMHDSTSTAKGSEMTTIFYSDGLNAFSDVYNNLYYHSIDDPVYYFNDRADERCKYQYFSPGLGGSHNITWGNTTKTFESPEDVSFKASDYPGGYPFYAGALRDTNKRFTLNLDRAGEGNIKTLGNETLGGGATIDNDRYVIFPSENAYVEVDDITISEKGAKLDFYYSADIYNVSMEDLPVIKIEFMKGNISTGSIKQDINIYDPYTDILTKVSAYVPPEYSDCDSIRIYTDGSDIRFAKLSVDEFDYDTENAKRVIPYDANVIMMGSIDEIRNVSGHTPMSKGSASTDELDVENYTYLPLNSTLVHSGVYLNRTIDKVCDEISTIASSNATCRNTVAEIYIGRNATGEKIAEIDYNSAWPDGSPWTRKVIKGKMLRTLQPGTYDFYIKWSGGGTTTSYALALY